MPGRAGSPAPAAAAAISCRPASSGVAPRPPAAAAGRARASAVAGARRLRGGLAQGRDAAGVDAAGARQAVLGLKPHHRGAGARRRSGRRPGRAGSRGAPSAAAPRARAASRSGWRSRCRGPTLPADQPRGNRATASRVARGNGSRISRPCHPADAGGSLPAAERGRRRHQGQRRGERCQGPSPIHLISDQSSVCRPARTPAEGRENRDAVQPGRSSREINGTGRGTAGSEIKREKKTAIDASAASDSHNPGPEAADARGRGGHAAGAAPSPRIRHREPPRRRSSRPGAAARRASARRPAAQRRRERRLEPARRPARRGQRRAPRPSARERVRSATRTASGPRRRPAPRRRRRRRDRRGRDAPLTGAAAGDLRSRTLHRRPAGRGRRPAHGWRSADGRRGRRWLDRRLTARPDEAVRGGRSWRPSATAVGDRLGRSRPRRR